MIARTLKALAVVGGLALAGCGGNGGAPAEGDMAMGADEGAKVTVVEYASVTCGACAAWQERYGAEFKAKYIDTDKVRFVFREFPTPPQDISVAGFLVARCAGADKYFDVVYEIMHSQKEWQTGIAPRDTLIRVASAAGLDQTEFNQCVTDEAAVAAMEERIRAAQGAGISGTPTFLVNGQQVTDYSIENLSRVIDAELAK